RRDLLLELVRLRHAEVVADRRAADVEAQPGAAALELGEVLRRRAREVVLRQLDGVEGVVGGEVDELVERHLGLLEVEVLAERVGGEAEAEPRLAGAGDRLDGGERGGAGGGGARGQGGGEELAALHGGFSGRLTRAADGEYSGRTGRGATKN